MKLNKSRIMLCISILFSFSALVHAQDLKIKYDCYSPSEYESMTMMCSDPEGYSYWQTKLVEVSESKTTIPFPFIFSNGSLIVKAGQKYDVELDNQWVRAGIVPSFKLTESPVVFLQESSCIDVKFNKGMPIDNPPGATVSVVSTCSM